MRSSGVAALKPVAEWVDDATQDAVVSRRRPRILVGSPAAVEADALVTAILQRVQALEPDSSGSEAVPLPSSQAAQVARAVRRLLQTVESRDGLSSTSVLEVLHAAHAVCVAGAEARPDAGADALNSRSLEGASCGDAWGGYEEIAGEDLIHWLVDFVMCASVTQPSVSSTAPATSRPRGYSVPYSARASGSAADDYMSQRLRHASVDNLFHICIENEHIRQRSKQSTVRDPSMLSDVSTKASLRELSPAGAFHSSRSSASTAATSARGSLTPMSHVQWSQGYGAKPSAHPTDCWQEAGRCPTRAASFHMAQTQPAVEDVHPLAQLQQQLQQQRLERQKQELMRQHSQTAVEGDSEDSSWEIEFLARCSLDDAERELNTRSM